MPETMVSLRGNAVPIRCHHARVNGWHFPMPYLWSLNVQ